jgi:hypothetical protein
MIPFLSPDIVTWEFLAGDCKLIYFPVELATHIPNFPNSIPAGTAKGIVSTTKAQFLKHN